jgi:hypothetical protein
MVLALGLVIACWLWAAAPAQAQVYSSPFIGTYTVNPYPVYFAPISEMYWPRGYPNSGLYPPYYWYTRPMPGLPMYGTISSVQPYPWRPYPYGSFYYGRATAVWP